MKLANRAVGLGLDWRAGLSDITVARYRGDYTISHNGRSFVVGPHVVVGQGQGAQRCSRIYLVAHPGDDETPRALIVGLVGRHLPDSTT